MKPKKAAIIILFLLLCTMIAIAEDIEDEQPYTVSGQITKSVTSMAANVEKEFSVESYYGITQLRITPNINQGPTEVTVMRLEDQPADVEQDITCDVYRYLLIDTTIPNPELEHVEIDFKIEDDWLENETRGNIDNVVFLRYEVDKWVEIDTLYERADSRYYYFIAEPKELSYFAIAYLDNDGTCVKKVLKEPDEDIEVIPVKTEDTEEPADEPAPTTEPEKDERSWWLFGILAIVAVLGILIVVWYIVQTNRKV